MSSKKNRPNPDDEFREALAGLLDYLWSDEQADFEANGQPEGHIFRALQTVRIWMQDASKTKSD